jgi:hypothetical protein
MTYLIVGLDRRTLVPWHRNVLERDAASATRAAVARAGANGIDLVIAAVIGSNSSVLGRPPRTTAARRLTNDHDAPWPRRSAAA